MSDYKTYGTFRFTIWDYLVFLVFVLGATGVGLFFAYRESKGEKTEEAHEHEHEHPRRNDFGSTKMSEYLLGSRQLKIFPVAMSLVGSYVSGVTIVGTASEIYNYGTQYWFICIAIIFMAVTVSYVYLPVFCAIRVTSSYQYLELRFGSVVRSMASFMFLMDEVFFLPIIVYVPALSLGQVTGINLFVIAAVICIGCVAYTLLGGIRAVVYTDAWQIVIMFVAVALVVILGTIAIGGPGRAFAAASEGGRLIFDNINPSPYERQTVWGALIGGYMYWTAFNAVNQTMVQRYMSLPNLKKARQSILIFTVGIVGFLSLCCFSGLLIYEYYMHCDPLSAGLIDHDDQLLPAYVITTVGKYPGIPGLFTAGVFGAALSSLSVVLNSTALVLLEDIVKGCFKVNISEKATHYLVRGAIVALGVIAFALVFLVERLSGVLDTATSLTAIAASASFGCFTLGMLVPWSNSKGALAGAAAGIFVSGWISFGRQYAIAVGNVVPAKLPVMVDECPGNVTQPEYNYHDESDVFPFYRLSYLWITPFGVATTVLVGTIASFIAGATKLDTLDADLISPVVHKLLPEKCFEISSAYKRSNTETGTNLLGLSTKY